MAVNSPQLTSKPMPAPAVHVRDQRKSLVFAWTGLLMMGLTNYIIGLVSQLGGAFAPVSGAVFVWLGSGAAGVVGGSLLVAMRMRMRMRMRLEERVEPVGVGEFEPEPASATAAPSLSPRWLSPRIALSALGFGVLLAGLMLCLKVGFAMDPNAKGPIVSILACNSIFVAALSWKILKEPLNWIQGGGVVVAVIGITVIGLASSVGGSVTAIMMGVVAMGLASVVNFGLKYLSHIGGDSIACAVMLWCGCGVSGLVGLIINGSMGNLVLGLTPSLVAMACTAGVTLAIAMLCLKLAVKLGEAGPAAAIVGSNAVVVILLDLVFPGNVPGLLQAIGMAISLLGVITLSLGGKYGPKRDRNAKEMVLVPLSGDLES